MIPKYFRCGDPSRKCPLSVTKAIIKDDKKWTCPCANPNCVDFREPVGLIDGLSGGRARVVYGGVALVIALVIGILFFGGGNPSLERLKELQARLVPLESAVTESGKKAPPPADEKQASLRVSALDREIVEIVKQADEALATGVASAVAKALGNVDQQIAIAKHMIETINQPAFGVGVNTAENKAIIRKLQQLLDDAELALESVHTESPDSVALYEDFIDNVKRILAKARQAAKPPQTTTESPESEILKKRLTAVIENLEAVRARLKSPPTPPGDPWPPVEADIRIAACGDLAHDLVGWLTAAWSNTELFEGTEGRIFLSSVSRGKVLVESCSVEEGFARLAAGDLSVFFADRPPTESETNQLGSKFKASSAVAEVVALDAVTLLVNPDVPLDTFTIGEPIPLQLAAGPAGSSLRRLADRFGVSSPEALDVGGEQAVLSDPSLLALSLYHQDGADLKVKRLAIKPSPESVALKPSPFTIATADYRFSYGIVARTASNPTPEARSLVEFVTSNEGQAIVAEKGFVDLRLRVGDIKPHPKILAALGSALGVDSVSFALRLSTNFPFEVANANLDLKAQADLKRLPPFLKEFYPSHKVVILGFTDSDGGPEVNMPLSKNRAEAVAVELRRSSVETLSDGLGPNFPIDTNSTDAGKARNRRAEVWVVKP